VEKLLSSLVDVCDLEKAFLFDVASKIYLATDNQVSSDNTFEVCADMLDVVIDVSCIYGAGDDDAYIYDAASSAVIDVSRGPGEGRVLYLRHISSCLALVCLLSSKSFGRRGVLDYNIDVFRGAFDKAFAGPV
jgi:Ras-related GTP-binding protein C/D